MSATTTLRPEETTTAELVRTARTTGLLYLGLAITGLLSYMLIRNQLFVAGDPGATLAKLTQHEFLARLGIVMEMGVVLTQALVALWFYRLFARVNAFAAGSIAAFGLVNAVAILGSAALLAAALDVSLDASLTAGGGVAATSQLLYVVSGHLWTIGGIFFGLWLIPMGWLARRSGWMPSALGWFLMIGGVGYVLSALLSYLLPAAGSVLDLITLPATIGELWMVGYLCLRGVRRS
ncbi:MAG TPA: DUF4386 domain-containing protein [Propionicimonas sp.]|nr:DUF4386 domain-containing protein [Propionicimonas sp.]